MKKENFIKISLIITVTLASSFAAAQFPGEENFNMAGSGSTITLDLKGMDIVEVLKTLASKGNMNLIIGSNVRGRVTMFLKDVDVGEAFEIILLANNLASEKKDEVIYVMTQKDYEQIYGEKYGDKKKAKIFQLKYAKAAEVGKCLGQIKTKVGKIIIDEGSSTIVVIDAPQALARAAEFIEKIDKPTSVKIFELNYAIAEDLKPTVQEVLTKGVGTVQVDVRTNKIVVTDLKDKIDEIEEIIKALDTRLQQVLIDAKIMEITLTDEFKLGVDWEVVSNELQKLLKKDFGIKSDFQLAAAGQLVPGGEIIIGAFGSEFSEYAAMVQALKTVGDANILSSPRITVLNNEEAKILVGSSEPYATNTVTQGTSTTTTATSLTFIDIGVQLFVTPTINRDGFIGMKIRPEISSSTSNYTYGTPATTVPIVTTTQAETTVSIKDGTTIIIGGLIKDERSDNVSKVPFLGDIPFLGAAFKNTEQEISKKEIVIFLTPHIVSGDVDYLKTPDSPPIGEKLFTKHEWPTFNRRKPVEISPGYLLGKKDDQKKTIRLAPGANVSSPEEYYYEVTGKIMESVRRDAAGDVRISSGDSARIYFLLYSGGKLASKPVVIKSTNAHFGALAVEAVEKAAPFPPFPMSIREVKKDFKLDVVYEPDSGNKGKVIWRKEID